MSSSTIFPRSVPDPNLFQGLEDPVPTEDSKEVEDLLPTVAECLAHLELLGCFATLRYKVENSTELDKALELEEHVDKVSEENLWHLKFERWKRFVGIAAWRFERWWDTVRQGDYRGNQVSRETLPPLDVLMALHTFLLNPRAWHDYCLARRATDVWKSTSFDWQLIHSLIDNYDFTFNYPQDAADNFKSRTNLHPDLFEELRKSKKSMLARPTLCPRCSLIHQLPYLYPTDDVFATAFSKTVVWCTSPARNENVGEKQMLASYLLHSADAEREKALLEAALALADGNTDGDTKPANPVPNPLQLPLGILRQGRFIHDIHTHNLLIRSPAVKETIELGIHHLSNFFTLLARFPKTMFVPTTHVDLAWHTLLLSPSRYRAYSLRKTAGRSISDKNLPRSRKARILVRLGHVTNTMNQGRYVDHNDNIEPSVLRKGRDITGWLAGRLFGKEKKWKVCLCWECQYTKGDKSTVAKYREVETKRRQEIEARTKEENEVKEKNANEDEISGGKGAEVEIEEMFEKAAATAA